MLRATLLLAAPALSWAGNGAQFVSQWTSGVSAYILSTVNPRQSHTVAVMMTNTGDTTWTKAGGYGLGSQNSQDNWTWGVSRVELDDADAIAPGQSKTFYFTVTAPAATGSYNFQWRMVQEYVEWFGDYSPNVAVTVQYARSSKYQGPSADEFIKGAVYFTYHASWTDGAGLNASFKSTGSYAQLQALRDMGSNWVNISTFRSMETCQSNTLLDATASGAEPDDNLRQAIRDAKSLGLKVNLRVLVGVVSCPSGILGLKPTDFHAWVSSYKDYFNHHADIAQQEGVDLFGASEGLYGVTTDANGFTDTDAQWRDIIAGARLRYTGPIYYSPANFGYWSGGVWNFNGEFSNLTWWDAVDYISWDAYPTIAGASYATVEDMKTGWKQWKDMVAGVQAKFNKPFIFAEFGYPSCVGTAANLSSNVNCVYNEMEQVRALEATFEVWNDTASRPSWFHGGTWWVWYPWRGDILKDGKLLDWNDWNPQGKLAEGLIKDWYKGNLMHAPVITYPLDKATIPPTVTEIYPNWKPVAGATKYGVWGYDLSDDTQRNPGNNCDSGHWLCVDGIIDNWLKATVQPGHDYMWIVHAVAANGAWTDQVTATFTTKLPQDLTPPTLSISTPTANARVSGKLNVKVAASDNVGVTKMELYVDGALKASQP